VALASVRFSDSLGGALDLLMHNMNAWLKQNNHLASMLPFFANKQTQVIEFI